MRVIKNGIGKAKHFADLAKVNITLTTKSRERKDLLDKYLADFESLKTGLEPFMDKYGVELLFNDYHASKVDKNVEVFADEKKEIVKELDYFYINGSFRMDVPIIDNDRHVISELISTISGFDLVVRYNIEFTLSEKMLSEVMAEATNNALDNIEIEVRRIAKHLGKHNIALIEIEFTGGQSYGEARMRKAVSAPTERERILDEMLESKAIEVTSVFMSEWEIV